MEFGSRMCKPANPDCLNCPLNSSCFAFAKNKVKQLPVKVKKSKVRDRYFHYLVIRQQGKMLLRKRNENDIWKNLYEFPLIETKRKKSSKSLLRQFHLTIKDLLKDGKQYSVNPSESEIKHQLSHQTIHAKFYEVSMMSPYKIKVKDLKKVSQKGIHQYPIPRLIEQYLEQNPI
jgi:A/G-specific adenine glycosylase